MATPAVTETVAPPGGMQGVVADWSSDQRAFKNVPWGKAMMWIFLLSDTFIFTCFLLSYMTVRMSKKIFHLILVPPTDRTVICDRIWDETGVFKMQEFRLAVFEKFLISSGRRWSGYG